MKGKGRSGKQARQQNKGKERADKRAWTRDTDIENIEIKDKSSGSDDSERGEESVGEAETNVCFIFFGLLRC